MEKRVKQLSGKGVGVCPSNGSQKPAEDLLDMIGRIIETDELVSLAESTGDEGGRTEGGGGGRSQSLTHIPGQFPHFAGSLPSLHHVESMHILHANYNSVPDFMQFGKFKTHLGSFDGTPGAGGGLPIRGGAPPPPGLAMGGGVVKEAGPYRRDSSQRSVTTEFQSSTSGYSSFSEQDELMQGVHKALDGGQGGVSRRNSLYESQSAVGTPVLTNDSAQNTPQGVGGAPFDYRNCGTTASENQNATSMSGMDLQRWNGNANGMPNTYQYTASSSSAGEDSSGGTAGDNGLMGGRLLNREGGGAGGERKEGSAAAAATAQMFCDYVGVSGEVGGVSKLGADEASRAKGSGAFELNMLPGSLKGIMISISK